MEVWSHQLSPRTKPRLGSKHGFNTVVCIPFPAHQLAALRSLAQLKLLEGILEEEKKLQQLFQLKELQNQQRELEANLELQKMKLLERKPSPKITPLPPQVCFLNELRKFCFMFPMATFFVAFVTLIPL